MRILVCAAEAPLPPMNGFRLQISPVCQELAKRHEVVVLAYRWPEQEGEPPPGVELQALDLPSPSSVRRAAIWLAARRPLGAVTANAPMADAAAGLLAQRDFDVVHVAGWPLAGLAANLGGLPAVLTTLDAWYLNYRAKSQAYGPIRQLMYLREAARIGRFEARAYRAYSSVVVVSDEDAAALRALDSRIAAEAVPNGVDAEHFAPDPATPREPGLVTFTGAMQWAPNASAAAFLAKEVMPRLRSRRPEAHLALVGRSPGRDVLELAELPGVEVTGEVADIRDWLRRAEAFACPMVSGTGIKNKLLEAMASGIACVATPLACQGMAVADGRDVLLASSADAIADALAHLLADEELRNRMGSAGREYALANHSWEAVGYAYERLLEKARQRE